MRRSWLLFDIRCGGKAQLHIVRSLNRYNLTFLPVLLPISLSPPPTQSRAHTPCLVLKRTQYVSEIRALYPIPNLDSKLESPSQHNNNRAQTIKPVVKATPPRTITNTLVGILDVLLLVLVLFIIQHDPLTSKLCPHAQKVV